MVAKVVTPLVPLIMGDDFMIQWFDLRVHRWLPWGTESYESMKAAQEGLKARVAKMRTIQPVRQTYRIIQCKLKWQGEL